MTVGGFRVVCPFLLLPGCLLAGEVALSGDGHNIRVDVSGAAEEAIRLEARHVQLVQVLDAIADETGVRIHYSSVPNEFVSVNCAGASVKPLMECLLGPDADLIFRYPDNTSKNGRKGSPVELWVLESSFTEGQAARGKEAPSQCSPAADQENAAAESVPSERIAKLLDMAAAEDPTQRSQALSQLAAEATAGNAAVKKALEAALSDEDPSVRAQAVYGLARSEGAGAAAILHAALHDSDVSVRLMAVDSAGRDTALLYAALADSDAAVRRLATLKLEELSNSEGMDYSN